MTEDQESTQSTPEDQTDSTTRAADAEENFSDDILRELTVIGNKVVKVVDAAWNSEERKRLQTELKDGLSNIATNLESGVQKVGENEQAQDVLNKAEDMASSLGDQIRSSESANDLADGLIKGLRALGTHLEKLATDLSSSRTADAEGPSDAQDIPIDKE